MTSGQDIVPNEPHKSSESSSVSDAERWGTLIGGGALYLWDFDRVPLGGR